MGCVSQLMGVKLYSSPFTVAHCTFLNYNKIAWLLTLALHLDNGHPIGGLVYPIGGGSDLGGVQKTLGVNTPPPIGG